MRIVLDTNILVRAHVQAAGPARELLLWVTEKHSEHVLIVSEYILAETARVLRYPRLSSIFGLHDDQISEYVGFLRRNAEITLIPPPEAGAAGLRDDDDVPVLQTAIAGKAAVLCTLDRHFHHPLVLGSCLRLGFEVVTDVALLRKMREQQFLRG